MPHARRRDRFRQLSRPLFEPLEGRALLASLMVTNLLDSGAGSLRQAITDADTDAASGASTIVFAIPGSGVQSIKLATALPDITAPVTIDGTSQPGYSGSPLVAIDGGSTPFGSGLTFRDGASGSLVEGLAIERFQAPAIDIERPRVTVEDNVLGLDPTGATGGGNTSGILLDDDIGAFGEPGTIISGNIIANSVSGPGIDLSPADAATITRNFIGTDATGRTDIGNSGDGIRAVYETSGTTISDNIIANNGQQGIEDLSQGGLTLSNNTLTNNGVRFVELAVVASDSTVINLVGRTIMTTYTVTNNGPATAGVAGLNLFSKTSVAGLNRFGQTPSSPVIRFVGGSTSEGTVTVDSAGKTVTASFGSLAPGASASVTVATLLIGSGTDSISVAASSTSPMLVSDYYPTPRTAIIATGQSDLAVAGLPLAPAVVGSPEVVSFLVTNRGSTAIAAGQFALVVGPSATVSAAEVQVSVGYASGLGSFPAGFAGTFASLAPGASATVTATITPDSIGPVTATLYAYSTYDTDSTPANNLEFVAASATTSPSVLGATLLPATGAISALSVYFNTALDPSEARNLANYKLTTVNSTSRIALKSATYDATTQVVALRMARSLPRQGAPLRLVVAGPGTPGLTGSDGSKLLNAGARFTLNRK